MATFGTTAIPSDQISVGSGGTYAVSAAFSMTVGLVGGMDTENGSATPGETVRVESSADAGTLFGDESELKEQVDLAIQNEAGTVYACPVSETETTETFDGSASGVLDNVPVFDPRVQPDHTIEVQDTSEGASVDVNEIDESPPPVPTEENTVNINPNTGEFEADESSTYDITYSYGDYAGAITSVIRKVPRFVGVCTENTSLSNDLLTNLNDLAKDFDFMHGVVGAEPDIEPSEYEHSFDDRRLIVVAPSRAYTDAANTNMVRTVGAAAGMQAGNELGDSTTYEDIGGFADLNRQYGNQELGTLIDNQVYPIKQGGGIQVVKDMTTSSDARFERVYRSEIVDEAAEISHQINQQYIGELNTEDNRFALAQSHDSSYSEMEDDDLLDAFNVAVSEGANPDEVNVDIGLDVVDVMDVIDVDITVGDVITFEGAS